MNKHIKLEQLQENVSFWKYMLERSNSKNAREIMDKLKSAKNLLKAFKRDNLPQLLKQPKHNFKPIPFMPMSDFTEVYEEYNF